MAQDRLTHRYIDLLMMEHSQKTTSLFAARVATFFFLNSSFSILTHSRYSNKCICTISSYLQESYFEMALKLPDLVCYNLKVYRKNESVL